MYHTIRKTFSFLVIALLTPILFSCISKSSTPAREETPALTPRPDFSSINAELQTTPSENSSAGKPFTVSIKNAFLFDPSIDTFAKSLSSEEGIHLAVFGSIRNNTDRTLHRGGIFATLFALFPKRTEIERHSSGLGFNPQISSKEPWSPGSWREFVLITRAMDSIYREYIPQKIYAQISLEIRDPLDYRYNSNITSLNVIWRPFIGAKLEGKAKTASELEKDQENKNVSKSKKKFKKQEKFALQVGSDVDLLYQRGGGYKILTENGDRLWVRYNDLIIEQSDQLKIISSKAEYPKVSGSERAAIKVYSLSRAPTVTGLPLSKNGYWIADVEISLKEDNPHLKFDPTMFSLDLGGQKSSAINGGLKIEGAITSVILKEGESIRGMLFFPDQPDSLPFELEFSEFSNAPIGIDVLPPIPETSGSS